MRKKQTKIEVGQGTIEYLAIIGIVIVVALSTISLLTSFNDTDQISTNTEIIQSSSKTLALNEALLTTDGNYLIKLKSNSAESITINSITLDGEETIFDLKNQMLLGSTNYFPIYTNDECENGTKIVKTFTINFTTKHGLQKKETFENITFLCQPYEIKNEEQLAELKPTINTFSIPATSASTTINITLTANDNPQVTGYKITESNTPPLANDDDWTETAPTTYTFTTGGTKILYAWVKDASGNVSDGVSNTIIITLPDDVEAPTVDEFIIMATSSSLIINIETFTATDDIGVTGYLLTESDNPPLADNEGWTETTPTTYTFTTGGNKTLYAWAKDASGNVSDGASDSTYIITDLVSHWEFNGDAVDYISGNTGTVYGATSTPGVKELENTAYYFDGVDDYIEVPDSDSLDVGNSLTISVWVKPTDLDSRYNIYKASNDTTANAMWLEIGTSDTYTNGVSTAIQGFFLTRKSDIIIPNVWQHIVYTRNGTGSTHALYINGVLKEWDATSTTNYSNNNIPKLIGARTPTTQLFKGSMDEMRIYNRALTQPEITALYNFEKPVPPVITSFIIPDNISSLTIDISTFTATSALGVAGYKITETSTAPLATATGWTETAPTTYTFTTGGNKTLYAWAKDALGNVSDGVSDSTYIITNLVSHWSFNNNAIDSINANNGTAVGVTATSGVKGVDNTAYYFDGVDDYIEVPDSDSLDVGNSLTISVWVKPTDLDSRYNIYKASNDTTANAMWLEIGTSGTTYTNGLATAIQGWFLARKSNILSPNIWQHIVYTRNGTGASNKLYINGVLVGWDAEAENSYANSNVPKLIGARTTTTQLFKGSMDEMRIYNRALTQPEITHIYNIEKP